jgi:hypothetical protein
MVYSAEVEHMCPLAKAAYHGPAPIPEERKLVQAKKVKDISGFTHGVGWCASQQGARKVSLSHGANDSYGVTVNSVKYGKVAFSDDDKIIVIAED